MLNFVEEEADSLGEDNIYTAEGIQHDNSRPTRSTRTVC